MKTGNTTGAKNLKAENTQLRNIIKLTTIVLKKKERELEIQTALEKVRVIALAMKAPEDMLEVCKNISLQLRSLGVKDIRNVQTAILKVDNGTYMNYEYYSKHRKTFITETLYTNHKLAQAFALKMMKGRGQFFYTLIKGQKVKDWLNYQKGTNVFIDKYLETATSLNYYWHSLGPVALGISTYVPLSKENLALFKRFLEVFELAYTRYLDIEQAIAQAKEAKIEVSLEKIRATAMAMHAPDDLLTICETLYKEFLSLGFESLRNAMINIHDDEQRTFINYDYYDALGRSINYLRFDIHPVIEKQIKQMRSADDAFSATVFKGKDLADWKKFRKKVGEKDDPRINLTKALYYYFYSIGTGSIGISTFTPIGEDRLQILKRFRNVFNLAYQRYSDIKLAEAQAREAKIELGLERIRARAMAMHQTNELLETGELLYKELTELGVKSLSVTYSIMANDERSALYFGINPVDGKVGSKPFVFPHTETRVMRDILNAWKKQKPVHSIELNEAETLEHQTYIGEQILEGIKKNKLDMPFSVKEFLAVSPQKAFINTFNFKQGYLFIIGDYRLTREQELLLLRFTKVFELTYRRFLDLQKAELQARESQIELGLERVRARAMAMQKSDELAELVDTVFKELTKLDFALTWCMINIIDAPSLSNTVWTSNAESGKMPEALQMKFEDFPFHHAMMNGWKKRLGKYVYVLEGQEKKIYDDYLFNKTEFKKTPEAAQAASRAMEKYVVSFSFSNFGGLQTVGEAPLSEFNLDILGRFGKVFDLTYTRFNDLKLAEAQAREGQIEASLERVRSRTMAMQKSEELKEVIQLVYEQFLHLNIAIGHTGFVMDYKAREDYDIWVADPIGVVPSQVIVPYFDSVYYNRFNEAKQKGEDFFATLLNFEEKNKFYLKLFEYIPGLTDEAKTFYFGCTGLAASTVLLENVALYIENFSGDPYTEEENNTLMRFGKVFQQTYTRFNDLKKAEAQARESQIQLALERVRARTMAMQNSSELAETAALLLHQFRELGGDPIQITIGLVNEEEKFIDFQVTGMGGNGARIDRLFRADLAEPTLIQKLYRAWKEKRRSQVIVLEGEELQGWVNYRNVLSGLPVTKEAPGQRRHICSSNFSKGLLSLSSVEEISKETIDILERFAGVFDQTYTRFLDLKNAEAQAREGQIELGLERVRARAMAMQNSKELRELIGTVFTELTKLDLQLTRCVIMIFDPMTNDSRWWMANSEAPSEPMDYLLPFHEHKPFIAYLNGWRDQMLRFQYVLEGQDKRDWDDHIMVKTELANLPDFVIAGMRAPERVVLSASFNNFGCLNVASLEPLSDEHFDILLRFAKVFDLTYTRFNDLKKAEAQAREARIEAALEKVRGRTMAMQKSDELSDTVRILFGQLKELGEEPERAFIGVVNEPEHVIEIWATQHGGDLLKMGVKATIDEPFVMNPMYMAWKKQERSLVIDLKGESLEGYFQFLVSVKAPVSREIFGERRFENIAFFSKGMLGIITPDERSAESIQLYERFAGVFDLTYTRFLDLQFAEAQAREARIETSLERVRGKAMAMHSSRDLSETINVFFGELKILGITPLRCGLGAVDEKEKTSTISATTTKNQGDSYEVLGKLVLGGHKVLENIFQHWKDQQEYFPVLKGKEITRYYQVMKPHVALPDYPEDATHYGCYFYFKEGLVFAWSETPFTDEDLRIFRRFTTVISLTYRRYIELQRSEANAREAVKQASLDRVRAEIASMRTINDLERITPLIWNELKILGLPFIRCGVFIMDNEQSLMHTFLSTPDGKAIAAFHLPYGTPGNVSQILENWKLKKIYTDHWDEAAFREWTETLVKQGSVSSGNNYLASFPEGGFYLHFVPFLQGMLYVGNVAALEKEEIKLVKAVADAFSTAYARYEDFTRLELAKQQVENTLTDLKQAQQQLVQSEKMASLGELTAGIAHEIQNPLNFVNNFSEVSSELLEEMKTELETGNMEEAISIADDVRQNLEKINHHGKRADAIVKGMLQHSRSSSGQKEPTDINTLCDEYLRLSYHGLRAKDKSFNAGFKTDFDDNLTKINVVPQDIGRVILNMINNAFYAVAEKKTKEIAGYEPIVTVSTKKLANEVEIRVKDNGMGIPPKVLDKIFQPFFTTKPTGQGTGLGLSLSYDIITKGHGGDIKVKTIEGEGSEFIIQLPFN